MVSLRKWGQRWLNVGHEPERWRRTWASDMAFPNHPLLPSRPTPSRFPGTGTCPRSLVMSINRNSFWGCCSTPKPGPFLSPTQSLEFPQGYPWNGYLQTSPLGHGCVHCLLCPPVSLLAWSPYSLPTAPHPMFGLSGWLSRYNQGLED